MNGRGSKLDGPGRLRIIEECRKNCDKLQNDALKRDGRVRRRVRPEIKAVATLLCHNRRTVMLWWNRRHQLDVNGNPVPLWKGNSGRPTHAAFATDEKIEQAIDVCVQLPACRHAPDAAKKFRMRDLDSIATHTRVAQLYEEIPKLWRSAKYRRMAVKAGNNFAGICGAIRTKKGSPTRR